MKKSLPLFILLFFYFSPLQAQGWSELGTGSHALTGNGEIYTICLDPSGNVYAAGTSWDSSTGHLYVAKWNGTSWIELGSIGLTASSSSEVQVLCSDSTGNIYAGGYFKDVSGNCFVAKWDGTSWSEVGGTGTGALHANGNILSLSFDKHGYLYAAGAFINAAGYYYVAKWDGTSWSEVSSGSSALNANGTINTIFIDTNDNIYAAGNFTDSGIVDTGGNLYVAMWNGTSWSELGSGVCRQLGGDIQIFSVLKDKYGNVIAAGNLWNDSNKFYVAKWDGSAWSELGEGFGGTTPYINNITAMMCLDPSGNLYAAGWLGDTTSGTKYTYVAKWDGTTWTKLGPDFYCPYSDDFILSICSDDAGNIYAAGSFVDTSLSLYGDTTLYPWDSLPYHPCYVAKFGGTTTAVSPLHNTISATVYPNPANTCINVGFQETNANFIGSDYSIYDCTGRIYLAGKLENAITSINIAMLPTGIYILKLGLGAGAVYKVVKE